jgi:hypothetical protein
MGALRALSASCLGLLFLGSAAHALGIGAIGDSPTDEYLGGTTLTIFETNLPARNWVQILAETRGLDFGAFEADGNLRGEPRNEGYAFNYARSSATALEPGRTPFIKAGVAQATLLATHIAAGDVEVVYYGLGVNDFQIREEAGGAMSGPDFDQFQADLLAEIFSAISVLEAAGPVDVIVGLIPVHRRSGDPGTPAAIAQTNALLAARATAAGLGVVDLFEDSGGHVDAVAETLSVGGLTFPLDSVASLADTVPEALAAPGAPCDSQGRCATLAYAAASFAHNRVHPGTHPTLPRRHGTPSPADTRVTAEAAAWARAG